MLFELNPLGPVQKYIEFTDAAVAVRLVLMPSHTEVFPLSVGAAGLLEMTRKIIKL